MAVLIIKRGPYANETAPECLTHYILDPYKMPNLIYGVQGTSLLDPTYPIHTVKNVFCHNYGKQMDHFILSFNETEAKILNKKLILDLAYAICEFFPNRQILFATHETNDSYESDEYNTSHLHIHFILNTTNVCTGYKERIDLGNVYPLRHYIGALLFHYNISDSLMLSVK